MKLKGFEYVIDKANDNSKVTDASLIYSEQVTRSELTFSGSIYQENFPKAHFTTAEIAQCLENVILTASNLLENSPWEWAMNL